MDEGSTQTDERLREQILQVLEGDPLAHHWRLQVEVRDGHVVLSGSIDDPMARTHAEVLLRGIHGVVQVRNEISGGSSATPL